MDNNNIIDPFSFVEKFDNFFINPEPPGTKNNIKALNHPKNFNLLLTLNLNKKKYKITFIMYILKNNSKPHINLNPHQIFQLCNNSDIHAEDEVGWTYLHNILCFNKSRNINLNNQQIIPLLDKAYLTFGSNKINLLYFHYILKNNKNENLGFTNQQLCQVYEKTLQAFDTKNMTKEKTDFIYIIKNHYKNFWHIYTVKKEKEKLNFIQKPKTITKTKL